ncbi:MAG: hypothetical protein ACI8ZM_002871 [Crocinitomix sp.]|jgi:hypothetical protein
MRYLILVSAVFLMISCKKEGCTDANAINYSEAAKENDGSCHYESTIAFWFDENKSDFYQAFDVTEFRFFVEDELVGTADINDFLVSAPTCGDSATVTYTRSLNLSKYGEFDYEITDQHDGPIQYGYWNASGNGCVVEKM